MATKAQRTAADKWDAANMAYQTVKVRRELLDSFKAACAARGDKVNTVLREAMEYYLSGQTFEFHVCKPDNSVKHEPDQRTVEEIYLSMACHTSEQNRGGAGDLGGDLVEAVPDGEAKILKDILTR